MAFDIDPKVIKGLSEGDQGAFRVVFEHYYPRVYEFIRRIVKSDTISEDIAQDIFVKIWERREMFGIEVHSFNKYIYVMSRNAAINAIRNIIRRQVIVKEFTIQANSRGSNDIGKVHMQVEYNGHIYYGFGANTDIIVASAEAYVDCINKFKK